MEERTFEEEKDLLTATLKKRRDKLMNRYKVVLNSFFNYI